MRPSMQAVGISAVVGMGVASLASIALAPHRKLQARETIGIDNSPAMLAKAPSAPGLRFELGSIEEFNPDEPFDLIFSNAAFHWVADHAALLERLRCEQIAVQMPMND